MKRGDVFMRKKINIETDSELNPVADIWLKHLIKRIIVEQLDIHHRLQAKLLYQDIVKERINNGSNNKQK